MLSRNDRRARAKRSGRPCQGDSGGRVLEGDLFRWRGRERGRTGAGRARAWLARPRPVGPVELPPGDGGAAGAGAARRPSRRRSRGAAGRSGGRGAAAGGAGAGAARGGPGRRGAHPRAGVGEQAGRGEREEDAPLDADVARDAVRVPGLSNSRRISSARPTARRRTRPCRRRPADGSRVPRARREQHTIATRDQQHGGLDEREDLEGVQVAAESAALARVDDRVCGTTAGTSSRTAPARQPASAARLQRPPGVRQPAIGGARAAGTGGTAHSRPV